MIIGLIISVILLLFMVGYLFFTQKYVYIHHSLLLPNSSDTLLSKLEEIEFWPSWLPWTLYDDELSIETKPAHDRQIGGATIRLKGKHIGVINCLIETVHRSNSLSCSIETDSFYPSALGLQIEWGNNEEGQSLMQLKAYCTLSFWQRARQLMYQRRINADMRLLLLRLKARLEPSSDANVRFTHNGCHKLPNIDAVTKPFIVNDHSMSVQMEQGFRDLTISLGPENRPAGPSFALYEHADIRQHYFTGKLGIPIQCYSACEANPERIAFKGKYMSLIYQGSYQHLWLAWHVLYTFCRTHRLNPTHKRLNLEVYEISPRETNDSLQFVTVLYIPIM